MELIFSNEINESIEALKKQKLIHLRYREAANLIYAKISSAKPGEMVLCAGPSRVGKSSAANETLCQVQKALRQPDEFYRPILRLTARNSSHGGFYDTKTFMSQALAEIGHPVFGGPEADDPDGVRFVQKMRRTSEEVLTTAFERAARSRQVQFIAIDEVQHLQHARGGLHRAEAILDSWKCLAEQVGAVLLLTGAYPISQVLQRSPHFLGRRMLVHFPRYTENDADLREFKLILNTLDPIVPMSGSKISDLTVYLMRGSIGCIGLLLRWSREALALAMAEGRDFVTVDDFNRSRMPRDDQAAILREIHDGETWMTDFESNGLGKPSESRWPYDETGKSKKSERTKSTQTRRKPFKKKPKNHKVKGRA